MNGTRLLGALVICVGLCSPAWAGNPFSKLKTWTAHLTGASCGNACDECSSRHVCCREDACKVAQRICQLKTAYKARHRERAAAKLDKYKCCCYPEIVPALIEALNDCDADVREEAAESLGELECCTPEVIAALERAMSDPDRSVRSEAKEALEDCGVRVVKVKPCRRCGGCDACGTCGCGHAQASAYPAYAPAPEAPYDAPSPMPEVGGDPQARIILPYHPHDLAASSSAFKPRMGLRRLFKFGRR